MQHVDLPVGSVHVDELEHRHVGEVRPRTGGEWGCAVGAASPDTVPEIGRLHDGVELHLGR